MVVKKIGLVWIAVSDIEKAKKFFTETVGLTLTVDNAEHSWLELQGTEGGASLGICQEEDQLGKNAIITFTIDDIKSAKTELEHKGVQFIGDIQEVPGHVKMALFADADNNMFQLVELL